MNDKHSNENKCCFNSDNNKKHNHNNGEKCGCSHDHEHKHNHEHNHGQESECACSHDRDSCSCGCEHSGGLTKKVILYYILGALLLLLAFLGELQQLSLWVSIPCAAVVYLLFGREAWLGAYNNIIRKRFFTEFTLMCVATIGAVALGEFADAAAVMYLYSLGETVSGEAYSRSKKNISRLIEITEENVTVVCDGASKTVPASKAKVGDVISVRVGDRIALDGVVVDGSGYADTSAVTGESIPRELNVGDVCLSGIALISGALMVRVTEIYENSTASKLKKAVDLAAKQKAPTEKKITRFAEIFTPIAFAVALAVFAIGLFVKDSVGDAFRSALVVLVASCPCALVLSVPLAYFSGIGRAAGRGIVFRGGQVIDNASLLGAVVFDKTGTLTSATPDFIGVKMGAESPISEKQLLDMSKAALLKSPHASAKSFCEKYTASSHYKAEGVKVIGGRGIVCAVGGRTAAFGNRKLMAELGVKASGTDQSAIYAALDGKFCGALLFSAKVKDNALGEVSALRGNGVVRVAIMSGDTAGAVKHVADVVGVDEYYSELKPDEKLERFNTIYREEKKAHPEKTVAFCGDGLNDSAAIARADVGIAMGSGSTLTVESADVVIVDDNLARINDMVQVAKDTVKIAEQNIWLSLGVKLAVVFVGLFAYPSLGLAIIADVGTAVLTVLNATRAGRKR